MRANGEQELVDVGRGRTPTHSNTTERRDRVTGASAGEPAPLTVAGVLALQRSVGNAAVRRLLASSGPTAQRVNGAAVTYKRTFTQVSAAAILDASENRAGSTGAAGHSRSQHVGSRKATLGVARAEGKKKTLYRSKSAQDQAAAGALNSSAGQTALARLDADATVNRVIIKEAATHPVQAWVATPTSRQAEKTTSAKTTVIVDRLATLPAPDFHIQTCYPVS